MTAVQTVPKIATRRDAFHRPARVTSSAREGIAAFLRWAGVGQGDRVALPAYVGWSVREGSGIYDPLRESGAEPCYFRVDRSLEVDVDDFRRVLREKQPKAVFLVHYFGMPDPAFRECARLAREAGAKVLEDEAHAMLTDLVGGVSGRGGDAAVFSLHKMLPTEGGGMLLFNDVPSFPFPLDARPQDPFAYDLARIASRRRENAFETLRLLRGLEDRVEPLWDSIPLGVVPQTLPVLIHGTSRDDLYGRFNERGFGGVSLYHTMVEEIAPEVFPDSHWLARRIFNLPVHQDVELGDLPEMVDCLSSLVRT